MHTKCQYNPKNHTTILIAVLYDTNKIIYSFSGINKQTVQWKESKIRLSESHMHRCHCMIRNESELTLIILGGSIQLFCPQSHYFKHPISEIIDCETWYDLNNISFAKVTLKMKFFSVFFCLLLFL